MRTDRIDFISQYCDRWCERCAFTSRCSAFAVQEALGMCGDFKDAIELAVGAPCGVGVAADQQEAARQHWCDIPEPTPKELEAAEKEEAARKVRLDRAPITKMAWRLGTAAFRWFRAHADEIRASGDAVVVEALEIVEWDSHFIGAKLHRALSGRDYHQTDKAFEDDDPVQNDWNGSAKIALLSIDRSETAWQVIAQATGDLAAADQAAALASLRAEVDKEFPSARSFRRPGFDQIDHD